MNPTSSRSTANFRDLWPSFSALKEHSPTIYNSMRGSKRQRLTSVLFSSESLPFSINKEFTCLMCIIFMLVHIHSQPASIMSWFAKSKVWSFYQKITLIFRESSGKASSRAGSTARIKSNSTNTTNFSLSVTKTCSWALKIKKLQRLFKNFWALCWRITKKSE